MTTRRTILFGTALVAGAAAAAFAAVQLTSAPAPVAQAAPAVVDPLAHSPCSVAVPAAHPAVDPLTSSPCSPAEPAPAQ